MLCWKELSFEAWTACQSAEGRIKYPLHIRWYWSRMRTLYDLAFLAADSLPLKAVIADSLKSRPALQWSAWDALAVDDKKNEECYKAIIEAEAQAQTAYIKDFEQLQEKCGGQLEGKESRSITDIPDNSTVIHFYLNKLEENGYAIIATGNDPASWEIETFKYTELFDAYIEWQTNYHKLENQDGYLKTAGYLEELCKQIGQSMPFLFDNSLVPDACPVIFVPHDFLHRIPIHGAIKLEKTHDKNVFIVNHECYYLPAWHYVQNNETNQVSGKILLKNFSDDDCNFSDLAPPKISWTCFKDFAASDDFMKISSPPEVLVILCHGKADSINPFNARLKLSGKGLSHQEILGAGVKLNGSCIILGACETDLVLSLSDVVDEHLSIATAFLDSGAAMIFGTMWKILPSDISEIVTKINNGSEKRPEAELWDWQNTGIKKDYLDNNDTSMFLRSVAFRVIGLPGTLTLKEL